MSRIDIVSGEGTAPGHIETFTGRRTARAILARLTRERCGGDRWAYVQIDSERIEGEFDANGAESDLERALRVRS